MRYGLTQHLRTWNPHALRFIYPPAATAQADSLTEVKTAESPVSSVMIVTTSIPETVNFHTPIRQRHFVGEDEAWSNH